MKVRARVRARVTPSRRHTSPCPCCTWQSAARGWCPSGDVPLRRSHRFSPSFWVGEVGEVKVKGLGRAPGRCRCIWRVVGRLVGRTLGLVTSSPRRTWRSATHGQLQAGNAAAGRASKRVNTSISMMVGPPSHWAVVLAVRVLPVVCGSATGSRCLTTCSCTQEAARQQTPLRSLVSAHAASVSPVWVGREHLSNSCICMHALQSAASCSAACLAVRQNMTAQCPNAQSVAQQA